MVIFHSYVSLPEGTDIPNPQVALGSSRFAPGGRRLALARSNPGGRRILGSRWCYEVLGGSGVEEMRCFMKILRVSKDVSKLTT